MAYPKARKKMQEQVSVSVKRNKACVVTMAMALIVREV
jgi:hypothetical protein